jgi:hypothetical protein
MSLLPGVAGEVGGSCGSGERLCAEVGDGPDGCVPVVS